MYIIRYNPHHHLLSFPTKQINNSNINLTNYHKIQEDKDIAYKISVSNVIFFCIHKI
jgi:hypothetical protein